MTGINPNSSGSENKKLLGIKQSESVDDVELVANQASEHSKNKDSSVGGEAKTYTNVFSGEANIYDQFIDNILPELIGRNPREIKELKITRVDIGKLNPKLILSSDHLNEDGKKVTLEYTINFSNDDLGFIGVNKSENKIEKAFNIPKNLDESNLSKMHDSLRAMFIADPILNRRFVSGLAFQNEYFQDQAIENGLKGFAEKDSSLTIMPTGTGKTEVAWGLLDEHLSKLEKGKNKALFIVNNRLILDDAATKLKRRFGDKYSTSEIYDGKADFSGDVLFATPVSLSNKMKDLEKHLKKSDEKLAMFLYDEVHHLPAETYTQTLTDLKRSSVKNNWNSVHAGFSATPERMDRLDVFRFFGKSIDFEFPVDEAWKKGYLVQLDPVLADNDINPEDISPIVPKTELADLYKDMRYDDSRMQKLPEVYEKDIKETGKEGKTLIIVKDNDSAEDVAQYFKSAGHDAVALTSRQKNANFKPEYSKQYFEDHYQAWKHGAWPKDSKYADKPIPKIVIAVDMFKEGVDVPDITRLMLASYTNSLGVFLQTVGRGLRPAPFKESLRLIDYVGQLRNLEIMQFMAEQANAFTNLKSKPVIDKDSSTTEDVEFNDKYTDSLSNLLDRVPYTLERRYVTYSNIYDPREIERLDLFFASYLLDDDVDDKELALSKLETFFESTAKKIESEDFNPKEIRDLFFNLFNFEGGKNDKDMFSHEKFLTHGPTQIVYEHVLTRLTESFEKIGSELNMDAIDQIFPEFGQKEIDVYKNLSQNMRFMREKVFKLPRMQLVELFHKEIDISKIEKETEQLIEEIRNKGEFIQRDGEYLINIDKLKSEYPDLWHQIEGNISKGGQIPVNDQGEAKFSTLNYSINEKVIEIRAYSMRKEDLLSTVSLAEGVKGNDEKKTNQSVRQTSRDQNISKAQIFIDAMIMHFLALPSLNAADLSKEDYQLDPARFKEVLVHKGIYQGLKKQNSFIGLFNTKITHLAATIRAYDADAEASKIGFENSLTQLEDLIEKTDFSDLSLGDLDTRNLNRLRDLYQTLSEIINDSEIEVADTQRIHKLLAKIYNPAFIISELDVGNGQRLVLTRSKASVNAQHLESKYDIRVLDYKDGEETNVLDVWDSSETKFTVSTEPGVFDNMMLIVKPSLPADNTLQNSYNNAKDEKSKKQILSTLVDLMEDLSTKLGKDFTMVLPKQEGITEGDTFIKDLANYVYDKTSFDLLPGIQLKKINDIYKYTVPNNEFIDLYRTSLPKRHLEHLKKSKNSIIGAFARLGLYKEFYEPRIKSLLKGLDNYLDNEDGGVRFGKEAADVLRRKFQSLVHWKVTKEPQYVSMLKNYYAFNSHDEQVSEEYINYAYLNLVGAKEIFTQYRSLFMIRRELNSLLKEYMDLKQFSIAQPSEENQALLNEANLLFAKLVEISTNGGTNQLSTVDLKSQLNAMQDKISTVLADNKSSVAVSVMKPTNESKPEEASSPALVTPPYISKSNKDLVVWMTKRGKKKPVSKLHWDPNCNKVTDPAKGTKVIQTIVDFAPSEGKFTSCKDCKTPPYKVLEKLNKETYKLLAENSLREIEIDE